MKRILGTTALTFACTVGTAALADSYDGTFVEAATDIEVLGSDFIGSYVYVVESGELSDDYVYIDGDQKEWDNVGDINDIVLSRDGTVKAVVIGVGGFIGIGEKDVAVNMEKIRFVSDGADYDEYFVVFESSLDALEAAPSWAVGDDRMRTKSANWDMIDDTKRDGYVTIKMNDVADDQLIGARVYGVRNENIGEVSELIMASGSGEKMAVIDVGGFLGIGEKPVAMASDKMRILRAENGDDVIVYVDATEAALEDMPKHSTQ